MSDPPPVTLAMRELDEETKTRVTDYLLNTWENYWFRTRTDLQGHMSGFNFEGWVMEALDYLQTTLTEEDPGLRLPWANEAEMYQWYEAVLWPWAGAVEDDIKEDARAEDDARTWGY